MTNETKKLPLKRKLFLFGASYALIGSILVFYYGMPLIPLVLGGLLALFGTLGVHFMTRR